MKKKAASLLLLAAGFAGALSAQEKDISKGIPRLDHAFVIVMENHGYQQIVGNPNEPYLNNLIQNGKVNLATNYFAVGHPSLTNFWKSSGAPTSASVVTIHPIGAAKPAPLIFRADLSMQIVLPLPRAAFRSKPVPSAPSPEAARMPLRLPLTPGTKLLPECLIT